MLNKWDSQDYIGLIWEVNENSKAIIKGKSGI
jgi:hypothetical protein